MRRNSNFFKQVLLWVSFIAISFLCLSSIGFAVYTFDMIKVYGWAYEQTVIVADQSLTTIINLKYNVAFSAWLICLSLIQLIQFIYLRYLINQSKD